MHAIGAHSVPPSKVTTDNGQSSTFFRLLLLVPLFAMSCSRTPTSPQQYPVKFTGGHEIGKNDFGRPVPLIAAALGVEPDVFREAFSGVTPAHGRGPTGDEARKNKAALMRVLAPHGITNERLDQVSDYYRYRPQNGELWRTTEAEAHAIVENGEVKQIVITNPGSGYSSPPTATIPSLNNQQLEVILGFSKDFKKNGAVSKIELEASR